MKTLIQKLLIFSCFLLAIVIFADTANACSCSSPSLNSAIESSTNIVLLKLQSVEKYQNGESSSGYGAIKQSKLTVEKTFKGNLNVGDSLTIGQGGGADCIMDF